MKFDETAEPKFLYCLFKMKMSIFDDQMDLLLRTTFFLEMPNFATITFEHFFVVIAVHL